MHTIAIDVDDTIVDSTSMWVHWMIENHISYGKEGSLLLKDYKEGNLEKGFKKYVNKQCIVDPLNFWRSDSLYDKADEYIIPEAKAYIEDCVDQGNKIVFVTTLKGNHHKSKYNFIKRNFPYFDGFVGTKEKWHVRADVYIDDNPNVLHSIKENLDVYDNPALILVPNLYSEDKLGYNPICLSTITRESFKV